MVACLGFVIVGISAPIVHAQTVPVIDTYETRVNDQDFFFILSPETPGPNQDVTVLIDSDLVDVNRYFISWTVDGTVVDQGIGKKIIQTKTKGYGESTTISFSIRLADSTVTKTTSLVSEDITLLWEAPFSYVPPFYQGKALPSYESFIRITAIPNFLDGTLAKGPKTGVYQWKRDRRALPNIGGYGKDSILIQHNRIRPNERIDVTASTVNRSSQGETFVTIPIFEPKIAFYQKDSITGITSPLAKKTVLLRGASTDIIAEPFFFSVVNQHSSHTLSLAWEMNDRPLNLEPGSSMLRVTNPETRGASKISLGITNVMTLFQEASSSLSVAFTQ